MTLLEALYIKQIIKLWHRCIIEPLKLYVYNSDTPKEFVSNITLDALERFVYNTVQEDIPEGFVKDIIIYALKKFVKAGPLKRRKEIYK